jgi:endonuclease YncB( thermonuclease family)
MIQPFFPLAALVLAQFAWAGSIEGRVVGIADGDTLTLLDAQHQQHKIRLAGIDAPEAHQATRHSGRSRKRT